MLNNPIIPEGVTKIGWGAFKGCSNITNISFPDSLIETENCVFQDCINLLTVRFAHGLQKLDFLVFDHCPQLMEVYFPDLPSWMNVDWKKASMVTDQANLFINGEEIHDLVIPGEIKEIPESACEGYNKLYSVTVQEGVEIIGAYAFQSSQNLETVYLPESLKRIEERAFAECSSLKKVVIASPRTKVSKSAFVDCCEDLIVENKEGKHLPFGARSSRPIIRTTITKTKLQF